MDDAHAWFQRKILPECFVRCVAMKMAFCLGELVTCGHYVSSAAGAGDMVGSDEPGYQTVFVEGVLT